MPSTAARPDPRLRLAWLLFGGFSLAAVLTGCWVASAHGVPGRALIMNLAAWAVGAVLALAISRAGSRVERAWPVIALIAVAATLLSPGLSGVHRWIALGPLRLNAAELFLAPALVALAGLNSRPLFGLILPLTTLILLASQPDASQAAAFAAASILMLFIGNHTAARRLLTTALFAAVAVMACLRPDPLAPVPEVEGIIGLAVGMSPVIAGLAVLALAGAVLSPLTAAGTGKAAARGLTAYLALTALAPILGAFPVPLVGMGVSPILGAWLGFGALMNRSGQALISGPGEDAGRA
jgi:hypothetical protein